MKLRSPTEKPVHIALRSGHTCLVTPEGIDVDKGFIREALSRGCRAVGVDMEAPPPEADVIDRQSLISKAIQDMLDGTDEGAFTADGKPNLNALSKFAGFQVSREERDAAWDKVAV